MKELSRTIFEEMERRLDSQDDPKAGIFWYNPETNSLFGVHADFIEDLRRDGYGMMSCGILHRDLWKKEYRKQKYKNNGIGPFIGDYKDKPRGRIFYNPQTKKFEVFTGKWIEQYPEAKEEIMFEFDLNENIVEWKQSWHWDIGCGYEF